MEVSNLDLYSLDGKEDEIKIAAAPNCFRCFY